MSDIWSGRLDCLDARTVRSTSSAIASKTDRALCRNASAKPIWTCLPILGCLVPMLARKRVSPSSSRILNCFNSDQVRGCPSGLTLHPIAIMLLQLASGRIGRGFARTDLRHNIVGENFPVQTQCPVDQAATAKGSAARSTGNPSRHVEARPLRSKSTLIWCQLDLQVTWIPELLASRSRLPEFTISRSYGLAPNQCGPSPRSAQAAW